MATQKGAPDDTAANPAVQTNTTDPTFDISIRENPLSKYASYTYQLSLYGATSEAWADFAIGKRENIDSYLGEHSMFAIIKGGGSSGLDIAKQEKAFANECYMDNLTMASTGLSQTNVAYDIKFQIIEPYGFSFWTKLRQFNKTFFTDINDKVATFNSLRGYFILGITFLGYDDKGNLLDSSAEGFDRYFDMIITKVSFKLDGRTVLYNVEATPSTFLGASTKFGNTKIDINTAGITVDDHLRSLQDQLNAREALLLKNNSISKKTTTSFTYVGPDNWIQRLKTSKARANASTDKQQSDMSKVKKSSDSTPNAETKSTPDIKSITNVIQGGTPIVDAIETIVKNSTYVEDALSRPITSDNEPNQKTNEIDTLNNTKNKEIIWIRVVPYVSGTQWDEKRGDSVPDITYAIHPYYFTAKLVPGTTNSTPYYGPFKKYEYWYTGKNTEILKYEQIINNNYYIAYLAPDSGAADQNIQNDISIVSSVRGATEGQKLNKKAYEGLSSLEAVTNITDPESAAQIKMTILGDPDWLANVGYNLRDAANPDFEYNAVQNPDGTANFNSQMLFTVNFNEAEDYDNTTGIMNINDHILMWDYSKADPRIQDIVKNGLVYSLTGVTNTFKDGKFTQELTAILVTSFPGITTNTENSDNKDKTANHKVDPSPNVRPYSEKVTGVITDDPTGWPNTAIIIQPKATTNPDDTSYQQRAFLNSNRG